MALRVITVKMDDDLIERIHRTLNKIKRTSQRKEYSRSDLIREAIDFYLSIMERTIELN